MTANALRIIDDSLEARVDTQVPSATFRNFSVIDGGNLLLEEGKLPSSVAIGEKEYTILELPDTDKYKGLSFYGNRRKNTLNFVGYNPQDTGHRAMANDILHEAQLRYKPLSQWTKEDIITYELLSANDMIGW